MLKVLVTTVALALVLASPAQASEWPALTSIASQIAGPVTLTCSDETDPTALLFTSGHYDSPLSRIWGYTYPADRSVTLSRLACAGLLTLLAHPRMDETYTIMGSPGYNRGIEGMAVHALTHELGHIKYGYLATTAQTERAAECYARANDRRVALAFGISAQWASWMHRQGEAMHSTLPPMYQGACS